MSKDFNEEKDIQKITKGKDASFLGEGLEDLNYNPNDPGFSEAVFEPDREGPDKSIKNTTFSEKELFATEVIQEAKGAENKTDNQLKLADYSPLEVRNIQQPDPKKETPMTASQLISSLYRKNRTFSFNIAWVNKELYIFFLLPNDMVHYTEDAILSSYRFAEVKRSDKDYNIPLDAMQRMDFAKTVMLKEDYFYPTKIVESFESEDPLATLCTSVLSLKEGEDSLIQFVLHPSPAEMWRKEMERKESDKRIDPAGAGIKRLLMPGLYGADSMGKVQLSQSVSDELKLLSDKKAGLPFGVNINIYATNEKKAHDLVSGLAVLAGRNRFVEIEDPKVKIPRPNPPFYIPRNIVLTNMEIASFIHPSTAKLSTPTAKFTKMKVLDFPAKLDGDKHNMIEICKSYNRGIFMPINLTEKDVCDNMLILGSSGTGKSTVMKSIGKGFIEKGWGFAAIDPKNGDLIKGMAGIIKKEEEENKRLGRPKTVGIEDIVFFNPWNKNRALTLNILAPYYGFRAENVASAVTDSLRRVWAYSWGPRLDYILADAVKALTYVNFWKMQEDRDREDLYSFGDIAEMYVSDEVFDRVIDELEKYGRIEEKITGGLDCLTIKHYLVTRVKGILAKDAKWSDVISPLLNKIDRAASMSAGVELSIDTPRSSFDIKDTLKAGKYFLVNLPIDQDQEVTRVIGNILLGIIFNTLQETTMERETPYGLFLDEMQNFAGTFVSKLYREGRAFKISTIGATQFLKGFQGSDPSETAELQGAVTESVGSLFQFRTQLPEKDIASMFGEKNFDLDDFSKLTTQYAYLNTHQNKIPYGPLLAFAPFYLTPEEEEHGFDGVFDANPNLYIPVKKLMKLNREKLDRRTPGYSNTMVSDLKNNLKKIQNAVLKNKNPDEHLSGEGVAVLSTWLTSNLNPFSKEGIKDLASRLNVGTEAEKVRKEERKETLKKETDRITEKYENMDNNDEDLNEVIDDLLGITRKTDNIKKEGLEKNKEVKATEKKGEKVNNEPSIKAEKEELTKEQQEGLNAELLNEGLGEAQKAQLEEKKKDAKKAEKDALGEFGDLLDG